LRFTLIRDFTCDFTRDGEVHGGALLELLKGAESELDVSQLQANVKKRTWQ
jgi:hypothetical protein